MKAVQGKGWTTHLQACSLSIDFKHDSGVTWQAVLHRCALHKVRQGQLLI